MQPEKGFLVWDSNSKSLSSESLACHCSWQRLSEFKCFLVRGFNINHQTRSAAIVYAWFVMGGRLCFLVAATRMIVNTCFAVCWSLSIPNTLFWGGLRKQEIIGLVINWLRLLLLIWEAFVVPCFKRVIKVLYLWKRDSSHHLKFFRVDHADSGVSSWKSEDSAGKVKLINVKKTFFLNAKVCEELCIAS